MPPSPRQDPGLVRPEFGPSLPAWLQARAGIPPWATLCVVGVVVVAAAVAALARGGGLPDGARKLVHAQPPVFNVLYQPPRVAPAKAGPGELERLVAVGPHVRLTV